MSNRDPKPCPFCGADPEHLEHGGNPHTGMFIRCTACGARGPFEAETPDEAWAKWDDRFNPEAN